MILLKQAFFLHLHVVGRFNRKFILIELDSDSLSQLFDDGGKEDVDEKSTNVHRKPARST